MMVAPHQPSMKMGWVVNAKTLFKKLFTDDNKEAETKVDTCLTVKPRKIT